ncbi:MAG TPA: tetratricopeptide repeat protein [Polyangia bacterium]|jgi:TolA-binding protein
MRAEEHPEALIDRALRGALEADAQATLDRHLAVCPVCAAQVAMAPRFERELAPQPRDEALDVRAAEAALRRMQETPPAPRRHAAPPWFRWAAAAALVVCGVTAAAAVIGRRAAQRAPSQTPPPAVEAPAARAPIRPLEAAPAEAPPAPEPPPAREAARPARVSRPPALTAAALFEQGEQLRREGRADAAIATYRRLQATFPETPEAALSFAFAGQLLLKQRRPDQALAQFDRHLKAGGEVGEEALAGRATALEELGRRADAVAAWKSLLARYPGSVYAGRARARLDELR